jgi:hypothetical protein
LHDKRWPPGLRPISHWGLTILPKYPSRLKGEQGNWEGKVYGKGKEGREMKGTGKERKGRERKRKRQSYKIQAPTLLMVSYNFQHNLNHFCFIASKQFSIWLEFPSVRRILAVFNPIPFEIPLGQRNPQKARPACAKPRRLNYRSCWCAAPFDLCNQKQINKYRSLQVF